LLAESKAHKGELGPSPDGEAKAGGQVECRAIMRWSRLMPWPGSLPYDSLGSPTGTGHRG